MRHVGQGYEVEVPLAIATIEAADIADVTARFEVVYQGLFGRVEKMPLEVISWRVVISGPVPQFSLKAAPISVIDGAVKKGQRPVYFGEASGFTPTPVFDRTQLIPGYSGSGPAIIEERESTLVVPPGFSINLHSSGNLIVEKSKQ